MDRHVWLLLAFAIIGFSLVTIIFGFGGQGKGISLWINTGGQGWAGGCGMAGGHDGQPAGQASAQPVAGRQAQGEAQEVYIHALPTGAYDRPEVRVKAGEPVRLHFIADPGSGCGAQLLMEEFAVNLVSRNSAEQVATFTPQKPGTYEYHCGMHMFVGRMIVE